MSNASNSTGTEDKCKVKIIHGYRVELELFEEDGEPRSDCSVEKLGTPYAASLGLMMGFGTLENYQTGDEINVPERIQKAIIDWAEANGY